MKKRQTESRHGVVWALVLALGKLQCLLPTPSSAFYYRVEQSRVVVYNCLIWVRLLLSEKQGGRVYGVQLDQGGRVSLSQEEQPLQGSSLQA